MRELLREGDGAGALAAWRVTWDLTRLLFAEPNPSPIKHWFSRNGLIDSPEVRLPMIPVSEGLAPQIECEAPRLGTEAMPAVAMDVTAAS